jgi:hypothetical protein
MKFIGIYFFLKRPVFINVIKVDKIISYIFKNTHFHLFGFKEQNSVMTVFIGCSQILFKNT